MADLSEKAYLSELISDFRTNKHVTIDEAWQGIQVRYRVLDLNQQNFVELVLSENRPFNELFFDLARSIHRFMFDEVLSNAGEFRKVADPELGSVKFGPQDIRSPWGTKFKGSQADSIDADLKTAFALLSRNDDDPIGNSILFYQMFVRIHPFYDANGRVARFLVTLYLLFHGFYVLWKELEKNKKNEFLKRLNACHLREGKESFAEYFVYLVRFWKKYVITKKELEK